MDKDSIFQAAMILPLLIWIIGLQWRFNMLERKVQWIAMGEMRKIPPLKCHPRTTDKPPPGGPTTPQPLL